MAAELVPAKPQLVPLETRVRAKIAAKRTIAVAPPPGTRLTVTVEEAAALLGIGRDAAYREVKAGRIPSLTTGRTIVVPVQGLTELVEEACERAKAVRQGKGKPWPSSLRNTPRSPGT